MPASGWKKTCPVAYSAFVYSKDTLHSLNFGEKHKSDLNRDVSRVLQLGKNKSMH